MRRDFLRRSAALGVFGGLSCGRSGQSGLRTLSISLSERLSLSGAYLAEEAGYFREAGFGIEITRISGTQSVPLLAGGKLDLIFGGLSAAFLNAVERGLQIRIVAGREIVNPDCGEPYALYSHRGVFPDGNLDPQRLKGRRFSVRMRGITEFVLDTFLDDVGLAYDEVERIDLDFNAAIAALSNRKIDGMFDMEFTRSPLSISPDIVQVWRLADVLPLHQYSFILFGESLLDDDIEVGARFLAAYLKAAGEFAEGRTPQFMKDFAASYGLDEATTISACRDTFVRDGAIDIPSVQRICDWYVRKGYAEQPVDAAAVVDSRYVEEARRMLAEDRWRVTRAG